MENQKPFAEIDRSIAEFWQKFLRNKRNKLIVIVLGIFAVIVSISFLSSGGQKNFEEGKAEGEKAAQASKPQNSPTTSQIAEQSQSLPTPAFDSSLGNNFIAANFTEGFLATSNKAAPSYITAARVDLLPEDLGGKNEEDYKKNLTSVYLTVEVDSYLWSTTGESGQKDLAASFLNAITNTFGGIRHVKITNGIREVATAEWPLFGGEPKIELK